MNFRSAGLAFSLALQLPDDEGWVCCDAVVDVPGFHGELSFQLLDTDVRWFRAELYASLDDANWPCQVRLASTDPGIEMSFQVDRNGRVAGKYHFGGSGVYNAVLSGVFEMDQTYLTPLLAEVDRALAGLN